MVSPKTRAATSRAPVPALDAALRFLSVRARTEKEIRTALERKGYPPEDRDAAVSRLQDLRYLDDTRFAADRATTLLTERGMGPEGAVARLARHGLSEADARRAVTAAAETLGLTPLESAKRVLERGGYLGRTLDVRERARAERLLLGRGFDYEDVSAVLGAPALSSPGNED